jgi:hypothetical protein
MRKRGRIYYNDDTDHTAVRIKATMILCSATQETDARECMPMKRQLCNPDTRGCAVISPSILQILKDLDDVLMSGCTLRGVVDIENEENELGLSLSPLSLVAFSNEELHQFSSRVPLHLDTWENLRDAANCFLRDARLTSRKPVARACRTGY